MVAPCTCGFCVCGRKTGACSCGKCICLRAGVDAFMEVASWAFNSLQDNFERCLTTLQTQPGAVAMSAVYATYEDAMGLKVIGYVASSTFGLNTIDELHTILDDDDLNKITTIDEESTVVIVVIILRPPIRPRYACEVFNAHGIIAK